MARMTQGPYTRDTKTTQKPLVKNRENTITKIVTLAEKIPAQLNTPIVSQPNTSGGGRRSENPFRRWIDSKLQARRDKGLCYKCDEQFSKGHHDKNKELCLYVATDDLEDTEMEDILSEEAMVEVSRVVELSLNSVVDLRASGTFKIKEMMEDWEIVIMIVCGATHNFISLKFVDDLNLPMAETTNYGVIMGSGKAVQGRGMCKGITVGLLILTIVEDFLLLELGNLDMVLGMQWLCNKVPCPLTGKSSP